jgi:hypothetical protein
LKKAKLENGFYNVIDGERAYAGKTLSVINPATGTQQGTECFATARQPEQLSDLRATHKNRLLTVDPAIGLRMITLNPPRHPADVAAQYARTFGDALRHVARSAMLNFSEHMRIIKTKNECSIEFTGALLNGAAPALFLDTAFALLNEQPNIATPNHRRG